MERAVKIPCDDWGRGVPRAWPSHTVYARAKFDNTYVTSWTNPNTPRENHTLPSSHGVRPIACGRRACCTPECVCPAPASTHASSASYNTAHAAATPSATRSTDSAPETRDDCIASQPDHTHTVLASRRRTPVRVRCNSGGTTGGG